MTTPVLPSVDQLQELPLPTPPFSYLPQTWGWLVLLLIAVCCFAWWALRRWQRWQRNRYRRQALMVLDGLAADLTDVTQRLQSLRELPVLLKRVALSAANAQAVAALSGAQWQGFLTTHARQPLPEQFAARLFTLAYAPDAELLSIEPHEVQALFAASRTWIETHHVAV
ncbi:DUF4381 domain-containing protein [Pseudomonas sp. H9]|uniref:DUF4381 domain-containing protein n=1 Tax=Pseudomonas sp. H9 TaxID=483968 RepID=UPI0010576ED3|nr:DUF4381 domain-containing protein [Pseudomonas sp. H9]TDF84334.1 DUF4381 domain-containing protein [Pseudomonas sp. H9]